eukprot:1147909-Pelagomonas_calceolata.AAC.2
MPAPRSCCLPPEDTHTHARTAPRLDSKWVHIHEMNNKTNKHTANTYMYPTASTLLNLAFARRHPLPHGWTQNGFVFTP